MRLACDPFLRKPEARVTIDGFAPNSVILSGAKNLRSSSFRKVPRNSQRCFAMLNITRNMQAAVCKIPCAMLALIRRSQRVFPFEQRRMRVIKAAVERVRGEIAQVFLSQFAQGLNE